VAEFARPIFNILHKEKGDFGILGAWPPWAPLNPPMSDSLPVGVVFVNGL